MTAYKTSRQYARYCRFRADTGASPSCKFPVGREAYHATAGRVVVIGLPHRRHDSKTAWCVPALVLATMEPVVFDTTELSLGAVRAPEVSEVWDEGRRVIVRHGGMIWEKHPLGARCRREWRPKQWQTRP